MPGMNQPMSTMKNNSEMQYATFRVDHLHLAIPMKSVQEINRNLETLSVPQAPDVVRGVINLRGDVVTVLDMRKFLDFPYHDETTRTRNIVVRVDEELIGLWVDEVGDILEISTHEIDPSPANLADSVRRYVLGVHRRDDGIVVLLDLEKLLTVESAR